MDEAAAASELAPDAPPRSWRLAPLLFALAIPAMFGLFIYLAQKPSPDRIFESGVKATEAKDYATAVAKFTEVLRLRPDDGAAYSERGYAHAALGDHAQAIADQTQAIRLIPRYANAYVQRAHSYFLTKQYDKALADGAHALTIDPRNEYAFSITGDCYFQKRDFPNALRCYDEAVRLNPAEARYFWNRGAVYLEEDNFPAAVAEYDQVLRRDPKNGAAFASRAYAHCRNKDYGRADADGATAIRLAPQDSRGYQTVAWMWATCPEPRVRNGTKAVEYATKACELTEWKDYWSLSALAAACAEVGRFDDAIKYQRQALEVADASATFSLRYAQKGLRLYEERQPYRDE